MTASQRLEAAIFCHVAGEMLKDEKVKAAAHRLIQTLSARTTMSLFAAHATTVRIKQAWSRGQVEPIEALAAAMTQAEVVLSGYADAGKSDSPTAQLWGEVVDALHAANLRLDPNLENGEAIDYGVEVAEKIWTKRH